MSESPRGPRIPGCLHVIVAIVLYFVVGILVTKYVTVPLGSWAERATGPPSGMGDLKALLVTIFWPFAFLFSLVLAAIRALGDFYRA